MTEDIKHPITIAVRRPSKTPAVFVAASFADPAWEPVELTPELVSSKESSTTEDSSIQVEEYEFSKQFELPEGKHQYKFCLGTDASSWFYDEKVETVVDEHGNTNNLLVVAHTSTPSKTEDCKPTNGTSVDTESKELTEEENEKEKKVEVVEDVPAAALVDKSVDKEAPIGVVDKAAPEEEKKPDDPVDPVVEKEDTVEVLDAPQEIKDLPSKDEVPASSEETNKDSKEAVCEEKSEDKVVKEEDTVEKTENTVPVDTAEMEQTSTSSVPEPVKGSTADEAEVIDTKPLPDVTPIVADIPKAVDTEELQQVPEPVTATQAEDKVAESTTKPSEESKEPEPPVEATGNGLESREELPEKVDAVESSKTVEATKEDTTDNVETPLVAESEVKSEEPKKDVSEELGSTTVQPESVPEPDLAPEAPSKAVEEPTSEEPAATTPEAAGEEPAKDEPLPETTKEEVAPDSANEPTAEKPEAPTEETKEPVVSTEVEKPTAIETEPASEKQTKDEPAAEPEATKELASDKVTEPAAAPEADKETPVPETVKEDSSATAEEPVSTEPKVAVDKPESSQLPREEVISDKAADPVATEDEIKEKPAPESGPVLEAVKEETPVAAEAPAAEEPKVEETKEEKVAPAPDTTVTEIPVTVEETFVANTEAAKDPEVTKEPVSKEVSSDDTPETVTTAPEASTEEPEKNSHEPEAPTEKSAVAIPAAVTAAAAVAAVAVAGSSIIEEPATDKADEPSTALPETPTVTAEEAKEIAPESDPVPAESKGEEVAGTTESPAAKEPESEETVPAITNTEEAPVVSKEATSTDNAEVPSIKELEPVVEEPKEEPVPEVSKEEFPCDKVEEVTDSSEKETSQPEPTPEAPKDEVTGDKTEPAPEVVELSKDESITNKPEDVTEESVKDTPKPDVTSEELVEQSSKEVEATAEEPEKDSTQPVQALKSTEGDVAPDCTVEKEPEVITGEQPVKDSAPEETKDEPTEEPQEPAAVSIDTSESNKEEVVTTVGEAPAVEKPDVSVEVSKDVTETEITEKEVKDVPADAALVDETGLSQAPEIESKAAVPENNDTPESQPEVTSEENIQPAETKEEVADIGGEDTDPAPETTSESLPANVEKQGEEIPAKDTQPEVEANDTSDAPIVSDVVGIEGVENVKSQLTGPEASEEVPQDNTTASEPPAEGETPVSREVDEPTVEEPSSVAEKPEAASQEIPESSGSKDVEETSEKAAEPVCEQSEKPIEQKASEIEEPKVGESAKDITPNDEVPTSAPTEAESKEIDLPSEDIKDEVPATTDLSTSQVVDEPSDKPATEVSEGSREPNASQQPEEVHDEPASAQDSSEKVNAQSQEEAVTDAPIEDAKQEEKTDSSVEVPEAPKEAEQIQSDVTKPEEELKSGPEESLDHVSKVDDKQVEEAVAEGPVTEEKDIETKTEPESQDEIAAAVEPVVDEAPVLEAEKENTTAEDELPEAPTSEVETPTDTETSEDTGQPTKNSNDEQVADKSAPDEVVAEDLEKTAVSENVPEPTGEVSKEADTNEMETTKEAVSDEQPATQEAGLQRKLQSTETKPEFEMDGANLGETQPKEESTTDKGVEPVDAPKTNGATIAAALGAAAVLPAAAFLAAQVGKSEATDSKTTLEKDDSEDAEHVNKATAQDQSKVDVEAESSKDTQPHPVPEQPVAAKDTSATDTTTESNTAVITENKFSPEPQAEESSASKDVQEAVTNGSKKAEPEASKSPEEPTSSTGTADADTSAVVAATNGTKTNGTKTNGTSEENRPPTGNKSVSSFTAQRRDNFLKALWRAIFVNFFGSLFGFRRRDTTA